MSFHEAGQGPGPSRRLSEWERATLAKLLSADFPGRPELAVQAADVTGASLDSEGSLALSPAAGSPAAEVVRRIPVEAEFEDEDGMTVHVLLHVLDGFLSELEIFREDSGPLRRPLRVDSLRLVVL